MTSIATNVSAVRTLHHGKNNSDSIELATERLSSGSRINKASDDAAGLFVAQRIKIAIRGMERAINNSQDGIGLLQSAEAAVVEIRNMVLRMRELAVQMANGVYASAPDRDYAQVEVNELLQQVDVIANNSNFTGVNLIDGSFQNIGIQSGHTASERVNISLGNRTADGLGLSGVSVSTQQQAKEAMETLNTALGTLSEELSLIGAYSNRFNHTISLLGASKRHNEISFGRIMDADIAVEATNLSKAQVLAQANTAMLAQSNSALSNILILFS